MRSPATGDLTTAPDHQGLYNSFIQITKSSHKTNLKHQSTSKPPSPFLFNDPKMRISYFKFSLLFLSSLILASPIDHDKRDLLGFATSLAGNAIGAFESATSLAPSIFNAATSVVGGAFATVTSVAPSIIAEVTSKAGGAFVTATSLAPSVVAEITSKAGGAFATATSVVGVLLEGGC